MRFIVHWFKNRGVRFFSLLLGICIVCALFATPPAVSSASNHEELADTRGHWAESVIIKWVSRGLAKGYGDGMFGPNDSITRAEFVTLLNRIFGYSETSDKSFPDVRPAAWYAPEIAKAHKAGIISGDSSGNMKPEAVISRQEAAVILTRAFSLAEENHDAASKNPELSADHIGAVMKYNDLAQIAEWALGSVGAMTNKGYVTGRPGNLFAPRDNLSRAEAVKMIDNVVGELINAEGTYTKAAEGNIVISSPGVMLKDTYIAGDLYLTEGIGTGTIQLVNVTVKGRTIIAKGIENISLTDTVLEKEVLGFNEEGKAEKIAESITEPGTVLLQGNKVLSENVKATPKPTVKPSPSSGSSSESSQTEGQQNSTDTSTPSQNSDTTPTPTGTATPTPTPTKAPTTTLTPTQAPVTDTTPPSVPTNLTGTAVSSDTIRLSWAACTDNVGVAGYRIYRDSVQIGTSTSASYSDTGLAAGTSYSYAVSAYDAAGNESYRSSPVSIKTRSNNDPAAYTLSVVSEHADIRIVPEKAAYSHGEQVKVTAVPHGGYAFGHWYGDAFGTLEQITITMDDNKTLYTYTPEKKTITLPGGVTMDFVRIPSGSYIMGNIDRNPWASQDYPKNAHRVNIAYEFYVQTTETTQEQLVAVVGINSIDANKDAGENVEWMRGNKKPAVYLPWGDTPGMEDVLDAHEFINELNKLGLGEFRLPSEAEWEYIARGPQTNPYRDAPYFFGEAYRILPVNSSSFMLDQYAWWGGSANPSSGLPDTAQLLPTPYGLYDIYGNVYEWCEDDWKSDYNGVPNDGSPYINPTAEYPYKKVLRGGWRYYTDAFRFTSYYRESHEIYFSHGSTGIRLVMKVPKDNQPPSMPTNLSAQAVSSAQINLTWAESTDNDRISGYKIYRNGECIGISHSTAFSDCGLEPGTTYTYTVQAFDAYGNTSAKTANITAKTGTLTNSTPRVQGQSVSVAEDGEIEINLQAFDDENDPVTYHIVEWPKHGYLYGLYADGTVPVVRYKPVADYYGKDSFTYRVYNSYSYSDTATVSINVTGVNERPSAEKVTASLDAGGQIPINLKGKDPDNDYLFYQIVDAPAYGNVIQVGADTVIYTPNDGYIGTDSFTYKASDGQLDSSPADVTITVTPQMHENVLAISFDGNINDISGRGSVLGAYKDESPYTGSLDFVNSPVGGKALSLSKEKGVYLRAEDSGALSGMNSLYISVYAKKTTVDRGGYILQKRDGYALSIFKNSAGLQVRTTAGIVQVNSYNAGINDTDWHHYEAYYNGHSACLYVDGVLKAKTYTCGAVNANTYPLYIGIEKSSVSIAFDGEIDQLEIRTKPPAGYGTDTEAPTIPVSLRPVSVAKDRVKIEWDESVDNRGVAGYRIYRNGVPVATSAKADYEDTGLTPNTEYIYSIAAYDAAGNESVQSEVLIVTTAK